MSSLRLALKLSRQEAGLLAPTREKKNDRELKQPPKQGHKDDDKQHGHHDDDKCQDEEDGNDADGDLNQYEELHCRKKATLVEEDALTSIVNTKAGYGGKPKEDANNAPPKRNMNAYWLYQNAMRERFKRENPGMTFGQLATYTSQMYKNLTPAEKATWEVRAIQDKARYDLEISAYVPPPPGHDSRGVLIEDQGPPRQKKRAIPTLNLDEWELEYGLQATTRLEVTSALCLFCKYFGREANDDERKRQLTSHEKFFSTPWRNDNIVSHMKRQHSSKWKEYNLLSKREKASFFELDAMKKNLKKYEEEVKQLRQELEVLKSSVKVTHLDGFQIGDDSEMSPLLPPDFFQTKDLASAGDYYRTVSYKTSRGATTAYRSLQNKPLSKMRLRKFVFGALYKNIFEGYEIIDCKKGDFALTLNLEGGGSTVLKIKLAEDPSLLERLVDLGRAMPTRGNARKNGGDHGNMYGIGLKNSKNGVIYTPTNNCRDELKEASMAAREYLEVHYPEVVVDIVCAEKRKKIEKNKWMPNGPGSSVMVSKNLGNSSHFDLDQSASVSIWVEEKPGLAKNWYFVLPNVMLNGCKGVLIKLCHGAVISWDGRLVRHCTSVTDVGDGNSVYGVMFGSCR